MKKIIIQNLSIKELATIMYGDNEMFYGFTEVKSGVIECR